MNTSSSLYSANQKRTGAMLVLFVMLLPVLIILAGLAINIAYLQLTRTEMQAATDASARAANRIYSQTGDMGQAVAKAQALAAANRVNNEVLVIQESDFTKGRSTRSALSSRYEFTPASHNTNALKLSLQKSSKSKSGPVKLLFPNIAGSQFASISTNAISTQIELDIALVIDKSGSMAYAADEVAEYPPNPAAAPPGWEFGDPVPKPSRWLDTRAAVAAFLSALKESPQTERVALVPYSEYGHADVELTEDYDKILGTMDAYSASFQLGGTNIGDGINVAMNHLAANVNARPWAAKIIIVMTDGINTVGGNPKWQAQNASNNGVLVFTVTFAAEADQAAMESVASAGGGQHFHADSGLDLANVFADIARHMPTLISK